MRKVDLTTYATQYDNMAFNKPSYLELLKYVGEVFAILPLAPNPRIADLASGTGNFTLEISKTRPDAQIFSLEYNKGFVRKLEEKVKGNPNIFPLQGNAEEIPAPDEYFDAVSIIHALNYVSKPNRVLDQIHRILKPEGYLVLADIGRVLNLKAHAKEMLSYSLKKNGIVGTLKLYIQSGHVIRENQTFVENQKLGIHPTHSLDKLVEMVESHGFTVEDKTDRFYLGDDDFIIAKKA